MTEPIQLNEELSHKYESYSNTGYKQGQQELNTLDEPVTDTIVTITLCREEI